MKTKLMTDYSLDTRLLALDTATEACSVALLHQGKIDAQFALTPREHTQRILPMVEQALQDQQLRLQQLDALVCCLGPGSFTGVRIGIGIAQGLAYGAQLPLIGISSLEALAEGAWRKHQANNVLVAIDARMGEVYWAIYQRDDQGKWQGKESEQVLSPQAAVKKMNSLTGEWMTAGTGWQAYPELLEGHRLTLTASESLLPQAEDMLPLAYRQLQAGNLVHPAEIEPIYLRNEVTWKKLPGR
ncbi:tRNA (adenosine(37)-N6)-threonylcarbamoyltransferase complex dimerization subunit type 1 TsaB [Tatumella ptyseos]|uniref:tRNA (adenosine(37)-N6)-threonylcarbamoyltransferase complex dimerization subunit type 1 TsaB n=1 Tax=Tatumella ptyseos TaxID=82987 RepID=UPI0026ECAD97|nr:tRNA (adenosine(37)-N6)-threonylcarbamoyltransferase complex dimerization subunit type 1 TsaB [Tatumella ptyseos]WKX28037.1 tRNA (adenosine(37)-N6)-threonylcarbamoyltransferase complex dimerization subunit type 1 TsaB [Tatumella ptyseos]